MDLLVERRGRSHVVAEGLLHHHTGGARQPGVVQALDDHAEQRGRDLEIEHRRPGVAERGGDLGVGGAVAEVAGEIGKASGKPIEDLVVDRLTAVLDALAGVVAQLLERPVVAGHAEDRAVEQPPALEAVQRVEGHDLRQVSGDAEYHEDISRGMRRPSLAPVCRPGRTAVLMGGPFVGEGCDCRPPARRGTSPCWDDTDVDMTAREFQELFDAVSNWGRWGADGRRGALNHLTPERMVAAAGLVSSGVTVSLSEPLKTRVRIDVPEPAVHYMTMMTDVDIGSGLGALRQGLRRRRLPQRRPQPHRRVQPRRLRGRALRRRAGERA